MEIEADASAIPPAIEDAIDDADTTVEFRPDTGAIDRATGSTGRLALGLGAVGAAGAAAFGAVAIGGAAAVGFGVSLAAQLEQARIGFTSMLGSGEEADAFLKNLQQFAAKTPFEFPDLVTGSRRLLAMGFSAEEVMPMLSSIGNAVAAMGGGAEEIGRVTIALGQMNAKGRVTAEEMMQLTEVGLPGWDILANAIGKTVAETQDLVTAGEISAETFQRAFNEDIPVRFGNAMEAQSQTLLGLFSTLKDTVSMALADAAAPLAASLRGALPAITELLSGTLATVGPVFANILGGLAQALVGLLPSLQPILAALGSGLGVILGSLTPAITAIGQILAAAAPGIAAFGGALATIGAVISEVFVQLGPSLSMILNLLGEVAGILGRHLANVIRAILPLVVQVIEAILPVLASLLDALQPVFVTMAKVLYALQPSLARLGEAFGRIFTALEPVIVLLADLVVQLFDELAPFLPDLADAFVAIAEVQAELGAELVRALLPVIQALIPPLMELVRAILPILPSLIEPLASILEALTQIIVVLAEAFSVVLVAAIAAARASVHALVDAVVFVRDRVRGVLEDIVGFFSGLVGRFHDIGSAIANAIADGFKAAWNFVAGIINDAIPDKISIPLAPDIDLPDNPIPTFHQGGVVPGRPGQEVLALLKAGERVLTPGQNAAMVRGGMVDQSATTNITVYGGSMSDPAMLAREIAWRQRFG